MEKGIYPDFIIGTSLGEYVSLAVSGVFPLKEILKFLIMQADMMYSSPSDGGMLSIIDDVNKYKNSSVLSNAEIAAVNSYENFVVSGSNKELNQIEKTLSKNVLTVRLNIGYLFHPSYINNYKKI